MGQLNSPTYPRGICEYTECVLVCVHIQIFCMYKYYMCFCVCVHAPYVYFKIQSHTSLVYTEVCEFTVCKQQAALKGKIKTRPKAWLPSKAPFWHMPDLYTLSYVNLTVKGVSTPVLTTSISPIQLPLLANKLFIMPPRMRNIHEYMWLCFSQIRKHYTMSYILQTLNSNKAILG